MAGANTPADIVQRYLQQLHDSDAVAEVIIASEIDFDDRATLSQWLRVGLQAYARRELTLMRMSETQRMRIGADFDPERIIVRVPVQEVGERVRYRSATLADCGQRELIALAEVCEEEARLNTRKAAAYRRLADLLSRRHVSTVAQLPKRLVAAAFEEHDEGGIAA
jgi:hypothetical protein